MLAYAQKNFPANTIGPTWRIEDGYWLLPKYTLGYDIISWIAENLLAPDGSGEPFELTLEQSRYILWLYAVDEDGEFVYRNSVLQRLKGW